MYKCPFHYIGSKAKLLPQILPVINKYCPDVLVDLFAGGFSVGLNCAAKNVVCNDKNGLFVSLLEWLYLEDEESIFKNIHDEISKRKLSKTNSNAYDKLRSDYNDSPSPLLLFLLISYSFNHQMRYNRQKLFNTPFGKNRSNYNPTTERELKYFISKLKTKNVTFSSEDFSKIQPSSKKPLVFVDPPYLISTGSYNDGNRGVVSWNDNDERRLYEYLDMLDHKGIAFVLTNFQSSNGIVNQRLKNFSKKYIVTNLSSDYKNSNYHKKESNQIEIMVRNFK